MKPFHIRGRSWTIIAGLVAAAALTPGDAPAPRSASESLTLAHAPEPTPPAAASHTPVSDRTTRSATTDRVPIPARAQRNAARGTEQLAPNAAQPGAGGRIVALDPETGQLGQPSADQLRALRTGAGIASVSRSEEGLVETRLTDGTVILDLDGRFQDHAVARLDRNGRLTYGCVHDEGKPIKVASDTASSTALEEK